MTNKIDYLKFCEKEKEMPIFSQPWHMDTVCGDAGWDVLLVKKGEEIAASMPFKIQKKFGQTLFNMPVLTKYWGPYFSKKNRSEKQQQRLMTQLIEQLPSFDFLEQNFSPSINNSLPFFWKGFEASVGYTFVLDSLDDLEKTYSNIHSKYRNNKIPKAEKIVQIISEKSLEDFYKVQLKSLERQGLNIPFSFDFFKNYDAILSKHNARKIFFAVDQEDNIHAAIYLIWDEQTVYLQMAGHDTKLRNSGAGILLIWHAIKYSKEVLGKNRFDFVGSMIKPITKVRQDFGATQIPYFRIKKYNSKILKTLHQLKNIG